MRAANQSGRATGRPRYAPSVEAGTLTASGKLARAALASRYGAKLATKSGASARMAARMEISSPEV